MRSFTVSLAKGILACLLLPLEFEYCGESDAFRSKAYDPASVADAKEREPRALKPQEKLRDYAVIEACLIDLTDAKSPANKNRVKRGRVGKYVVLGPTTSRYGKSCLSQDRLLSLVDEVKGQTIPEEIGNELRQRNSGAPFSIADFRSSKAVVKIRDIDAEFEGIDVGLFAEPYWRKYPDSWRYVYAFLPGYSRDGKTAVVVFDTGPSPHGAKDTYLLVKSEAGWKVKWRNFYFAS